VDFVEKLGSDALTLMAMVNVPDPALVEIAAYAGFDAVIIDAEHGPLTARDVQELVRAADAASVAALVRVPRVGKEFVLRSLDAGADGIIAPQVGSAEDASAIVSECRFPPEGVRGAGFYSRAFRYSLDRGLDVIKATNAAMVVGVQIETVEGVARAPEILSQPGVTFGFVGPTDLSVDHGSVDATNPWVLEAIASLASAGIDAGVPMAIYAADAQAARRYIDLGYRILAVGVLSVLTAAARSYVQDLEALIQ